MKHDQWVFDGLETNTFKAIVWLSVILAGMGILLLGVGFLII